jgi:HTH-type transcriptional regulator/antitoxin HigA
MAMMIRQKTKSPQPDLFLELVRKFPLRPIRDEARHQSASRVLRQLVGSKPQGKFSAGERDYIDALTILVKDYQQKQSRRAMDAAGVTEILRHLMEQSEMSVTDLGRVIGSRSAASMILHGHRHPSKAQMLRLAERFGVEPSLFFGN